MDTYSKEKIHEIVLKQREFFNTNATLDISFRIKQLKKLKNAILNNVDALSKALYEDLGRSETESYLCDIGSVILELNETIHGLRRWARPERKYSGLMCFPSFKTKVYKMPYGVSLIVSPFNFPILLSLGVLIASIAGGNTAVIKTSSKSVSCTNITKKIISETFNENYVIVIDGGHDVADYCLNERFDKIFYTGSPKIGKHVQELASQNLTPIALELGGETGNWCIIRKDANLKDAANKIAFFKALNSGQVCININQIAISKDVAKEFIEYLKQAFIDQLGNNIENNEEYAKLISSSAYTWCEQLTDKYKDRIVFGGKGNKETNKFSPTIIYPVNIDEDIVNQELFNPLLPIVEFEENEIDKLLDTIARREHGLALYLFTKDIKWAKKVMTTQQFGGGCINEVCVHMMVKGVPFNGVGHSGMGAYHGKWGFNEFTHPQSVLFGKSFFNLKLRQHPYTTRKLKLIKMFEK